MANDRHKWLVEGQTQDAKNPHYPGGRVLGLRGHATRYNNKGFRGAALGKADPMREVLGKMPIHALRWALITQILAGEGDNPEITPGVMEHTLRCMEYFERSARKIVKLLPRRGRDNPARLTDEAAIQHLAKSHPELMERGNGRKQHFADALGVSLAHISQVIKRGTAKADTDEE